MTVCGSGRKDAPPEQDGQPDPQRRMFVAGLTAAYLSSFVPPTVAQPASNVGGESFMNLSKFLTGRLSFDPEQGARLYEALSADSPAFGIEVQGLLALINDRKIDPAHLQRTLDGEGSALASLPRRIMTAWYTGVVGEGAAARCVTFETSLMHQLVADRLSPPSYCYGPHGSWTEAPV